LVRRGDLSLPYSQQGITLIELLVTITIVGVVTGLSLPGLSSWFEKGRLASEIDRIASRLIFLRQRAIIEGRAYRLHLEGGSFNSYAYDGTTAISCGASLSPTAESWIDLSSAPAAAAGTPNYARSEPIPQILDLVDSGCSLGTGLCSYPANGICFDASGHSPAPGGVVQYVLDGISKNRLEVSASGYQQRFRRRGSSDSWKAY
jgi:prepilin-type N-terminal cleavage/methylation domain-containing protein